MTAAALLAISLILVSSYVVGKHAHGKEEREPQQNMQHAPGEAAD